MAIALIALVAATLFAGVALYISLVEQPARFALDNASMITQWQASYRRALPIQASLAVIGGVFGLIAGFQFRGWQCVAGGLVLLTNWPLTLLVIMPTNKRLMALQTVGASTESRNLLHRWGHLHNIRTLLGGLAAALFAWNIVVS